MFQKQGTEKKAFSFENTEKRDECTVKTLKGHTEGEISRKILGNFYEFY